MSDRTRAAIYARCSTEEQSQNGKESVAGQIRSQMKIGQANGLTVTKVYEAVGYSREALDENSVLMEMLADAQAREFEVLLVREADRLGGNLVLANTLKVLMGAGITIWENGREWEPRDETQEMMLHIVGAVASFERKRIVKRMRRGRLKRLEHGGNIGRVPYGYRYEKASNRIVVEESEARVVADIFKL